MHVINFRHVSCKFKENNIDINMKKIITVKGKAGVGKTTSIKKIYEWIISNYAYKIISPNTWGGVDIKTIIEVDGFKIGICSAGDDGPTVKEYMNEFEQAECDIIICACRTKGKTFQTIQSYWEKGYLINYIKLNEISDNTYKEIERRILGIPNIADEIKVFSYGSNMLYNRIKARAKSARIYATGNIEGYKLKFHKRSKKDGSGKANIFNTNKSEDIVWGIIVCVDKSDKVKLDVFEGLDYGYEEKSLIVTLENSIKIKTTAYVATDDCIDEKLKPFDWYYNFVVEGAKENNLNTKYIRSIEKVEYDIDSDESRRKENSEILEKTRR
jgi:hypothetical protein